MFCFHSPTPGSRQSSPTEAVERMGPTQTGLEMMGQHHPHVLQQQNPAQNKIPTEDFQSQEAQNMGGMEHGCGVESLQFDYAGNQIQVDSSGTPVGLFDYSSQQQVCLRAEWISKMCPAVCSADNNLYMSGLFSVVPEIKYPDSSTAYCSSATTICPGCSSTAASWYDGLLSSVST